LTQKSFSIPQTNHFGLELISLTAKIMNIIKITDTIMKNYF